MIEEGKPIIASCSGIVLTHDLEKPYPLLQYKPHEGNVNCVVWNHNNLVLASCGNDGKIVLSHSRKYESLIQFDDDIQNSSPLTSIQFTSMSTKLASGGSNGRVKIYDLKNKCIAKTYSNHFGGVTCVDWHQNDYILASSSQVGDIFLYNTENDQNLATFSENNSVQQIKFSPFKSNQLASCCGDGRVSIWDVNSKQQVSVFQKHQSKVNAITFSPHNRVLATSASLDMTINFYDINEKKVVKTLQCESPLTALAFHSDGHTIIVGTLYGQMLVYDLRKGSEVKMSLSGHSKNQAVNYISVIKQNDTKSKLSVPSALPLSKNTSTTTSAIKEPNQNYSLSSAQGQNLIPPSTNLFSQNQNNKLNDTLSSMKSKTSDSLPPNPSKLSYQNSNLNNDGNFSDRDLTNRQFSNNNNNNLTSPSTQVGKLSTISSVSNQNQGMKLSGIQSTSPIPSAKQSQILGNSNINNSNQKSSTILAGKTSTVVTDMSNISSNGTQQYQRKMSSNQPEEDTKTNGLNKNYSTKHLYNQNQSQINNSLTSLNQQSNTKQQSPPRQDDFSEMKKSGLTNVQPYELPPKTSMIIERTNGRGMSQVQPQVASMIGDEFTDKQKQYIKNMMEDQFMDIKFHFSEQFQNLHIEIIRQFQFQQNELTNLLEQYVNKNKTLEEKMSQLQQENERLKKSSY